MGKVNPLLQISTEGLYDYKNPLVRSNIIELLDKFRETQDTVVLSQRLQELVKTTYNINLTVSITDLRVPAMVVHEQIAPESLPRYRPRSISDAENAKGNGIGEFEKIHYGMINLKTLKVGGIFADLPVVILLSDKLDKWTNEEIGVAFFHELGHYIDYVIMAASQFRSFGIVESLVRGIRGAVTVEAAVDLVKTASGEYGFKVSDPESLKLAATDEAIRLKLFSEIQATNRWFLYGDKNQKQQEYAADELPAAIFGPRVAAVALSKLLSMTSHPAYRSSLLFYGRTAACVALVIFGASTAMLPIAVFGAVGLAADQSEATQSITHPNPLTRLQRFRGLLLSDAKNPEMTRAQVTQLKLDLDLIDAEIARLNSANKSGLEFLMEIFSPTRRTSNDLEDYERGVAELQNNPIFLRAAQLRYLKD